MYKLIFKRVLDFFVSLITIVILSPLFLILFILVKTKLGSPVLFRQERPGYKGKIFTLIKFRTMTDQKDENGELLSDEQRLTKFGKFLRSTSCDELPELWNILCGNMSIVGPRPLLVEYLPLYTEEQSHRHDVRPGLTGLAQVNGRNAISWEEKFQLDINYVNNVTFLNDCKIILKTVMKVVQRDGISAEESVTIEKFKGSK